MVDKEKEFAPDPSEVFVFPEELALFVERGSVRLDEFAVKSIRQQLIGQLSKYYPGLTIEQRIQAADECLPNIVAYANEQLGIYGSDVDAIPPTGYLETTPIRGAEAN